MAITISTTDFTVIALINGAIINEDFDKQYKFSLYQYKSKHEENVYLLVISNKNMIDGTLARVVSYLGNIQYIRMTDKFPTFSKINPSLIMTNDVNNNYKSNDIFDF